MGAWDIALKDLRLQFRDRRALTVLLALPIIFITIIGLTTGQLMNEGEKERQYKIIVVDDDGGGIADEIVELLQSKKGLAVERHSKEEAEALLDDQSADAIFFIGPEFRLRVADLLPQDLLDTKGSKLFGPKGDTEAALENLDLSLRSPSTFGSTVANMENQLFAGVVQVITPYVVCSTGPGRLVMKSACDDHRLDDDGEPIRPEPDPISEVSADSTAEDPEQAAALSTDAVTDEHSEGNAVEKDESDPYQFLVPGFTVMFVFFLVNIMARSFLHERDLGTLRRLRLAPVRPTSLLIGKTFPFFVISLIQTVLLFGFGKLLFGMSWGPQPWHLLSVIVATSFAATGLGLLIATLVRSDAQVSAYANLVVIGLAGVSGCFMPRDFLPPLMRQASLATPHAWALIAYNQLLTQKAPNLRLVYEGCGWLLVFTAIFFAIGAWRFARARD